LKFQCERAALVEALTNVQRSVAVRSSIAALEGVHVVVEGSKVEFESYNMEFGVKTELAASDTEDGAIVVPAKIFADIAKRLPGNIVEIVSENLEINITCAECRFSIVGLDPVDFPKLPTFESEESILLPTGTISSMIRQTIFAVGDDEVHPVHSGVLMEVKDQVVTFVAVDGFRMALRRELVEIKNEFKIVVPGKTLAEILRLIPNVEGEIRICISERYVFFELDKYSVISRLLDGDFIDYNTAIPQNSTTEAKVCTRKFAECVERVSLIVSDRLKSPVKVLFEANGVKFSCSTALGKSSDELAAEITGEGIEIAFNDKYMNDALKNSDTDEVLMQFTTPLRPIKIVPLQGDSFLFLVLPVRLRE
jgi:DNA polymerase-3 subunit beta